MCIRYHSHINVARRLTLLLHLAGALVIDLGLSPVSALKSAVFTGESGFGTYTEEIPLPKPPSLDEIRAVLGLRFLHSV